MYKNNAECASYNTSYKISQYNALKQLAAKRGILFSQLLREIFEEYLNASKVS